MRSLNLVFGVEYLDSARSKPLKQGVYMTRSQAEGTRLRNMAAVRRDSIYFPNILAKSHNDVREAKYTSSLLL